MSDPTDSLLDTNVFIHAHADDESTQECQRFLNALRLGTVHSRLEPVVLHELSYALPRYLRQLTRPDLIAYLRSVLRWPGIEGDIALMDDALRRWLETPSIGFVDAYLAALAVRHACPVYTKNLRDFTSQGVAAPSPLPTHLPASSSP